MAFENILFGYKFCTRSHKHHLIIKNMPNPVNWRTRGVRNNNPFNIKRTSDRWLGLKPLGECQDKTFCEFYDLDHGLRAGIVLLRNYLEMGYDTVAQIISRYAPPDENQTFYYINYVSSFLQDQFYEVPLAPQDCPIEYNSEAFYKLCAAICRYESEYKLTRSKYDNIVKFFKLY